MAVAISASAGSGPENRIPAVDHAAGYSRDWLDPVATRLGIPTATQDSKIKRLRIDKNCFRSSWGVLAQTCVAPISRKFPNIRDRGARQGPGLLGVFVASPLQRSRRTQAAKLMLRIERTSDGDGIRFRLSGELRSAELREARTEIEKVMPPIILDLADIGIVDLDTVHWLAACEIAGFKVENAAPYIRKWMRQEKS
jgi:hypothetical protein